MLVKDEADVIRFTLERLLGQVDEVIVADNGSTDGTYETILDVMLENEPGRVDAGRDDEVGYFQSRKTTALAMRALERGHQWVVPNDADEFWYATDGRTLREYLASLAGDVMIVRAELYDHVPTVLDDPDEENPFARVGWRKRHRGALPKVACRLRPDLVIEAGNHSATTRGTGLAINGGLCVRHFSWRSADQYARKIANGARAYAVTDLPEGVGAHWRMHGEPGSPDFDERVREHFARWFFSAAPESDDTLMYDPAPMGGEPSRTQIGTLFEVPVCADANAEAGILEVTQWDEGMDTGVVIAAFDMRTGKPLDETERASLRGW